MENRAESMVLASFIGDSLALGAHWIYDPDRIVELFGRIDKLLKPRGDSYHPAKNEGEFTHYGDQSLVLLESLAAVGSFNLADFAVRWRKLFEQYNGYYDNATKDTLKNFKSGSGPAVSGSGSAELGGMARISPLVYCYRNRWDGLHEAVRSQTAMTHNNQLVLGCGEFFIAVMERVLNGTPPIEAMKKAAEEMKTSSPSTDLVNEAVQSAHYDSILAIRGFGQACGADGAFPSVIHLIARYENDLPEALIQNVMAGGDSASRGMVVGMVLGGYLGLDAIPLEWKSGLKKYDYILELLDKLE